MEDDSTRCSFFFLKDVARRQSSEDREASVGESRKGQPWVVTSEMSFIEKYKSVSQN